MSDEVQRVAMVGLGYIGLPTAAVMASRGLNVIGVDVNPDTVKTINEGNVHIVEPDLDIVVRSVVTTGNLRATVTMEPADAFLIAVPTPFCEGHKPDLSFIEQSLEAIASVLEKGNLIILESTSPVGTTDFLSRWLAEKCPHLTFPHIAEDDADIQIAHCPERVLPGHVLRELVNNDRIIGGISRRCAERASELYKIFVTGECLLTNARTAELSKLTENAYRDVNIAFANEMSLVCDSLDINVWDLIKLTNRHPRVEVLQPGPGVGGHCIAVDPWFIVDSVPKHTHLIKMSRQVNESKPSYIVDRVLEKAERFKNPIIACFGLSFKANIDDLRESPAMKIVERLAENEIGNLLIVEPNVNKLPDRFSEFQNVKMTSIEAALQEADIILGLVDHIEFKQMNLESLKDKIIIDTRGMWNQFVADF